MKDKRDECGCHRDCTATVMGRPCVRPCIWPDCLTPEEADELAAEVHAALTRFEELLGEA